MIRDMACILKFYAQARWHIFRFEIRKREEGIQPKTKLTYLLRRTRKERETISELIRPRNSYT